MLYRRTVFSNFHFFTFLKLFKQDAGFALVVIEPDWTSNSYYKISLLHIKQVLLLKMSDESLRTIIISRCIDK